jgi:S1-C subfamily serine protease
MKEPTPVTLTTEEMILKIVQSLEEEVSGLTDGQSDIKATLATHEERSQNQDRRISRMEKAGAGTASIVLAAVLALFLSGCSLFSSITAPPAVIEQPAKVDAVARAVNNTVALQTKDGQIFCSGVAAEGIIITADHCVDDGVPFDVLYKGQTFDGFVVMQDGNLDLAFVDAVGARLKDTVPLAEKAPALGSKVIWLGYPLGEHLIMGTGIVGNPSVVLPGLPGDYLAVYGQFIPGNSGGPVFNSKGALIGIVSRTMTFRGGLVSVGYAVPFHTLQDHLH